jgi:putative N6-adenine-specific DNA methylase
VLLGQWLRGRTPAATLRHVPPPPNQPLLDAYAVTAPGLEGLCAAELQGLGSPAEAVEGGASWRTDMASLYRANLELRTASRIIVRVGSFRARTFAELERRTAKLPWQRFLRAGTAVTLRVTSRKSKLYHTGAIAERILRILAGGSGVTAVTAAPAAGAAGAAPLDDDDAPDSQLIVVRLLRDECLLSVDSSGARLQQRGYRQALAKAPLRETLAAAMLRVAGWEGGVPLCDPLCGAGTIPIEAALLARRIAPGLARPGFTPRTFAFQEWPEYNGAVFDDVVSSVRGLIRDRAGAPILGSDRNAGAISASRANAARAGVAEDVEFAVQPLSRLQLPATTGHVLTNPPYGVRVGDAASLRPLYAELGRVLRERGQGWALTMLSADPRLDAATGLELREGIRTSNGGIPVRIVTGTVA